MLLVDRPPLGVLQDLLCVRVRSRFFPHFDRGEVLQPHNRLRDFNEFDNSFLVRRPFNQKVPTAGVLL